MEESGRWGWWGGKDDQVDDKRIGERREAERQGGVDWRQTVCVCVCARERQRSRERETMSERKFKLKTAQIVHKSYDGN